MYRNILIISATEMEVEAIKSWWETNEEQYPLMQIKFVVTGIATSMTILNLTKKLLKNNYDLVIQLGIAGTYQDALPVGKVVAVLTEIHGDVGYEDIDGSIHSLDAFSSVEERVVTNEYLKGLVTTDIPKVISLTVDLSSGTNSTVERRKWQYNADIENMEGFGLHLVANDLRIPYMQVRAISNIVEERNTENWEIPRALKNLKFYFTEELLPHLNRL